MFDFFLTADIEDQCMHLHSTFDAFSNDTITSSNTIDKGVIFGEKLIFRNFIRFFPTFFQ